MHRRRLRTLSRGLWALVVIVLVASACAGSPADSDAALADGNPGRAVNVPEGDDSISTADPGSEDDDLALDAPAAIPEDRVDAGEPDPEDLSPLDEPDPDDEPDDEPVADAENEDVGPVPVDEFALVTSELITFVETSRGHRFIERPEVVGLDDASFNRAFAELVAEDAERYREDYTNFTNIYRAMGVIEGDRDLEEIWTSFGDAGVIGFYDAPSGNVVLRGDEVNALTRTTLVHELVHALDDQIFDIDRDEYDDRDDEISWTFSALVEGNASVIENRYRATMTQAERDEEISLQRNLPRGVSISSFTNSFLDLQFGRYSFGETFVDMLWAEGQDAVDAAFGDPPVSSEQIIDPAQYGLAPDPGLAAPPADGTPFEAGIWGQAAWAAVLGDAISYDAAHSAASGWGGDWYVAWNEGDRSCVRAHIAADSASELDEYADAIEIWALEGDREVFYPTAELIRVTACG